MNILICTSIDYSNIVSMAAPNRLEHLALSLKTKGIKAFIVGAHKLVDYPYIVQENKIYYKRSKRSFLPSQALRIEANSARFYKNHLSYWINQIILNKVWFQMTL